jgi:nitroreductase
MVRYAPSGSNSQRVEWSIIDNSAELTHIREAGVEWMRWSIESRPEIAAALDLKRLLTRMENGKDGLLRGAPVLIITHGKKGDMMAPQACTIALSYLELAAKSLELGSCWVGLIQVAASFPHMREALALPEGHVVCGSIVLGYPKYQYHRIPLRNAPHIIWHP